jgi:hypothetical protein
MNKKSKDKGVSTPKAKETVITSSTSSQPDHSNLISSEKKRPKTAYNVFMKQTMAILKEEGSIEGKDRMKEVGKLWRELSDDEREVYQLMADKINEDEVDVETESKSKSKLTTSNKTTPKVENTKKGKSSKRKNNEPEEAESESTVC